MALGGQYSADLTFIGWESYYPFLIPQALPLFPLGVYCVYLKSVNRHAFPFIAIVDDLLREQHLKGTTPSDIHHMTHCLIDTDTDTDACATPDYHHQTSEGIKACGSQISSLLPSASIPANDQIFNGKHDAQDLEKIPGIKIPSTSIEHIDPALPSHRSSTTPTKMPTTMQAMQSGHPATVTASATWAGFALRATQSSDAPPKVEAPAEVGASVQNDTTVPFQRQPNGNQRRKEKKQNKAGAEVKANKEISSALPVETNSKEIQHQKSASPIENQPGPSNAGQGHTFDKPLYPLGPRMTEQKEMSVGKGLDAHWPSLSHSKPTIKGSKRTTVINLPSTLGYEASERSTPQASVQVEHEMPQSSAQASLQVDTEPPQSSTQDFEQVVSEPQKVESAEVKPKTKAQKKNERRRNAKQAKKSKGKQISESFLSLLCSLQSCGSCFSRKRRTHAPETCRSSGHNILIE